MSDNEEALFVGLHGIVDGPVTISSSSSLDSFALMDLPPAPGSSVDKAASGSSVTGSNEVDSSSTSAESEPKPSSTNLTLHSSNTNNNQDAQYALHPVSQHQLPLASDLFSMLQSTSSLPTVSLSGHAYGTTAPTARGATLVAPPGSPALVAGASSTATMQNSTPEFLYQLTKMLTDHENKEIIEWSNGRIEVHSPHKLETHVLGKYFRHSKVREDSL
jgi:hypothetical protein